MQFVEVVGMDVAKLVGGLSGPKVFGDPLNWHIVVHFNPDADQLSMHVLHGPDEIDSNTIWPVKLAKAIGAGEGVVELLLRIEHLIASYLPMLLKLLPVLAHVIPLVTAHLGALQTLLTLVPVVATVL